MKIDSPCAPAKRPYDSQVRAERDVQNVFSDILAQSGTQGYRSADCSSETPDGEQNNNSSGEDITACWQNWLAAVGGSTYEQLSAKDETLEDFQQIMLDAQAGGGYAAPQAFLSQLSTRQLATIQQVHHLANPIQVSSLDAEGSLNLLLPPPAQVDLNHDGLTKSGAANMLKFPDSNTSREVADAWYDATATLSPGERLTRELQMKSNVILANLHVEDNGRVMQVEPGSLDWVNPMESSGFSYVAFAQQTLESVEYFKLQTPREQYLSDQKFWSDFQAAMVEHGAK